MSHKYNARRTQYNGHSFDSLAECNRFKELLLLEAAGKISHLKVHPTFELQPAFTDRYGKRQRAIVYEADFSYVDGATEQICVEDVKGYGKNPVWLIKQKMFLLHYRHLDLRIIK